MAKGIKELINDFRVLHPRAYERIREVCVVTVSYSSDSEVCAVLFNNYEEACKFIREDFEKEKRIDLEENGWEIDENVTVCEEGYAVLGTIYPSDTDTQTVTWQTARIIDKRQ